MTREEFTGVIFNDLDPSETQISRSLEFSVVNSTEIALNILHKHKAHYFVNWETTYKIIHRVRKKMEPLVF